MLLIIYFNNKRSGFGIGKEERAGWLVLSSSASLPMWGARVSSVVLAARGRTGSIAPLLPGVNPKAAS